MSEPWMDANRLEISPQRRDDIGRIVRDAVATAESYDGTQASYEKVFDRLIAFEKCAKELVGIAVLNGAEREAALSQAVIGKPVTIQDLLAAAIENFDRRLKAGALAIATINTGLVFLPTEGEQLIQNGSGHGFVPPREEARTEHLIQWLNQHDPPIYIDDLAPYKGAVDPNMVRQVPYTLIQIPILDREILICDLVGQACFVGQGLRGPLFWATYRKPELNRRTDVHRIVHDARYEEELHAALFDNNPPKPKISIKAQNQAFPLTADIMLMKALEHAAAEHIAGRGWKLPSADSGEVIGMPGQNWAAWRAVIQQQSRGFDIAGLKGLGDFYNLFGLKNGQSENPEMIEQACNNMQATGHHGLEPQERQLLTADFILGKALEHAAAEYDAGKGWRLPTGASGPVTGMPGQKWKMWIGVIHKKLRGFDIAGLKGLGDFYNLFGLKNGLSANSAVIEQAWRNIQTTGHHGLKPQERQLLTADFILGKALEHAAAQYDAGKGWRLPTTASGPVIGMPGQNWKAWQSVIYQQLRGFDIAGLKVLGDLYNLFGLKNGLSVNSAVIEQAWNNLQATGYHGLTRRAQDAASTPSRPAPAETGAFDVPVS